MVIGMVLIEAKFEVEWKQRRNNQFHVISQSTYIMFIHHGRFIKCINMMVSTLSYNVLCCKCISKG